MFAPAPTCPADWGLQCRVELVAEIAPAERVAALEPLLRRRFELERQRQPGRGCRQPMIERAAQRVQPSVFRHRIVVAERNDVGAGLAKSAVARGVQAARVFANCT